MSQTIVDLRVIDDVFQSLGHYHHTASFPPGEVLRGGVRVHVLLTGFHLLPGNLLLKLLRAAKSVACCEGGASGLLERLWQYDLPTIQDVFYLQGTQQRKPLMFCGRASTLAAQSVDKVTGLHRPPLKQLEDFGFERVVFPDGDTISSGHCLSCSEHGKLSEFEKTLETLEDKGVVQENDVLIVSPAFGCRMDRTFNKFSKLYKRCQAGSLSYTTILMGDASVCAVLPAGKAIVRPPVKCCKIVCGLLPFRPTVVTTKGLRWNLEDAPMAMDGMVSSSNERVDEEVEVETTEPIVWFSELVPLDCVQKF